MPSRRCGGAKGPHEPSGGDLAAGAGNYGAAMRFPFLALPIKKGSERRERRTNCIDAFPRRVGNRDERFCAARSDAMDCPYRALKVFFFEVYPNKFVVDEPIN